MQPVDFSIIDNSPFEQESVVKLLIATAMLNTPEDYKKQYPLFCVRCRIIVQPKKLFDDKLQVPYYINIIGFQLLFYHTKEKFKIHDFDEYVVGGWAEDGIVFVQNKDNPVFSEYELDILRENITHPEWFSPEDLDLSLLNNI